MSTTEPTERRVKTTFDQREKYAEKVLALAKSLRATKGMEYSRGEDDINSNFKRCGAEIEIAPQKVAYIFAKKHWDSFTTLVKNPKKLSESIESRVADLINYLIIIAILVKEILGEEL